MNEDNLEIQRALLDVAAFRRALDRNEGDQIDSKLVGVTLQANLMFHSIAFASSLALCLVELVTSGSMAQTLLAGAQSGELRQFGVGIMGFVLAGLLVTLYFILWRAARVEGEDVGTYIARNFKYVKNLSLISDLLMKFMTVALLVLAGRAEWVGPALIAFTGDYLLQGRFFAFPTKLSLALGIACLALAAYQFTAGSASLLIPLAVFALVAGLSTARLAFRFQRQATLQG